MLIPSNVTMVVSNEEPSSPSYSNELYSDLFSFLSSPRADLRDAAAEATLIALYDKPSHDPTAETLSKLNVIPPLCRISSSSSTIAALASLCYLSCHDSVGNQSTLDFIEHGGIERMMEIALSNPTGMDVTVWRQRVHYACALLANATRLEKGALEAVGLSFPEEAIPTSTVKGEGEVGSSKSTLRLDAKPSITLLLLRFLNPTYIDTSTLEYTSSVRAMSGKSGHGQGTARWDSGYDSDLEDFEDTPDQDDILNSHDSNQPAKSQEHYDPYQHVASVLMNITQLESGQNFLLKLIHPPSSQSNKSQSTSHLQSLLPQLNSPNLHRRRGIAGTLKNCCFSQDSVWWLLNVVHLDKSLLLPLAGPEELSIDEKVGLDPDYWILGPEKVREPDSLVRLLLVEALLLLLASGRHARETLRERRMYVVIKLADMVEEEEGVSERMEECVQYLRRDEHGEVEGSSGKRAYEVYAKGMVERNRGWGGSGVKPALIENGSVGGGGNEGDCDDYDNID